MSVFLADWIKGVWRMFFVPVIPTETRIAIPNILKAKPPQIESLAIDYFSEYIDAYYYRASCPKCGARAVVKGKGRRQMEYRASDDLLVVRCGCCSYEWREIPLDRRQAESPDGGSIIITGQPPAPPDTGGVIVKGL